jgi:peptide/nickel transport system substrate-binding protein
LTDNSVRKALQMVTPKSSIINDSLFGFAEPADTVIPNNLNPNPEIGSPAEIKQITDLDFEAAREKLEAAGWEKNEEGVYVFEDDEEKMILSFDISTSNVPELIKISEQIADSWRKLGAEISVKTFETSDLNQNVIRPRNFEALMFGMVIDDYSDLYAFWHSSQRTDPGLNITEYANITTDELLDELRIADFERQKELIIEFNGEIRKDIPAIFLYTPKFIYVTPEKIQGIEINNIEDASDRFMNVHKWFINTDKVWSVFI